MLPLGVNVSISTAEHHPNARKILRTPDVVVNVDALATDLLGSDGELCYELSGVSPLAHP